MLATGSAGCNQRSTILSTNGILDVTKISQIANDCLHMVVNNDPGLKAFLASNASSEAKAARYLVLMTRSRFDVYPPVNASPTGTHSAVFVPHRGARVHEQRGLRPDSPRPRRWQQQGAPRLCVVERREWGMPAQLRAHRVC